METKAATPGVPMLQEHVRCAVLNAVQAGGQLLEGQVASSAGVDVRDVRRALSILLATHAVAGQVREVPFGAAAAGPLRLTALGRRMLEDCQTQPADRPQP